MLRTSRMHQLLAALIVMGSAASHASAIDRQPYAGCGTLEPGVECPRYVGTDGTTFSIPDTQGFELGAYVFVSGVICFDCPSICQEGPVFQTEQINACFTIPPSGPFFSACGTLVQEAGGSVTCMAFKSDDDGGLYLLQKIPTQFNVGDHVRISTNEVVQCLTLCSGGVGWCISNYTIQTCGEALDVCGLVVDYSNAPFFTCANFLGDDGRTYFVGSLGAYLPGHRARVSGFVEDCPGCALVNGCFFSNTIVGCSDLTGDGVVNVNDLLAVIAAWGPCSGPEACAADSDASGEVDVQDLLFVITNWSSAGP